MIYLQSGCAGKNEGSAIAPLEVETVSREIAPERADAKPDKTLLSGWPDEPVEIQTFRRLMLLSGSAAESVDVESDVPESDLRTVRVARASARAVGRLIAELYPPVGPGGTEHRFYLVYQSAEVMDGAAELAVRMDMDAADISTGDEIAPLEAFATAIPLYYELLRRRVDDRLAEELVVRFEYAANAEEVPVQVRWASAMIAAQLHIDYRADPTLQKRALLLASVVVPSDSLESFLAQAAQMHWFEDNGRRGDAADLARELTVRFDRYGDSFAFDECLRRVQGSR